MQPKPYSVSTKMHICGDILEEYIYQKPIFYNLTKFKNSGIEKKKTPKAKSSFSLLRAKQRIRRIINCNSDMNIFITLTFSENEDDLIEANYLFKKFRQKMEYHFKNFRYFAVPEFQKRGAVHYHLLTDLKIDPYILVSIDYLSKINIKKLFKVNRYLALRISSTSTFKKHSEIVKKFEVDFARKYWLHGFVNIQRIKDPLKVGAYFSKYISNEKLNKKNKFDDLRYYGKKIYFYSKKLVKMPVLLVDNLLIDSFKSICYSRIRLVKEYFLENDFRGLITIRYYNLVASS